MTPHRGPVFLDFPLDVFGPAEGELPDTVSLTSEAPDPAAVEAVGALIAGAERPAFIVGSDVYWAGAWDALAGGRGGAARPVLLQRPRSRLPAGRPRAGLPPDPRPAQAGGRPGRRHRRPAGLPPRLRPLRDGSGRPPGRLRQPAGRARRGHDGRRRPGCHPDRAGRPRRRPGRPRALDRPPPRRRDGRGGAGPGPVRVRRQPHPAGPHLRRAEPAPRARRGGHLRRRRLRQLRGQAGRGPPARLLARHRPVRLPRQRPRLRDRGACRAAVEPDRRAARGRRGRLQPDGRGHARAPRPAGRDDRRQQRHLGPGEAPDAGDLRLGRGLRPPARMPLRRGGAGARRRRRDGRSSRRRSGPRSTGPSRPACPTW